MNNKNGLLIGVGDSHFNLIKFRAVNEFSKSIIRKQEIYFAGVDELNDPFELAFRVRSTYTPEERKQIFLRAVLERTNYEPATGIQKAEHLWWNDNASAQKVVDQFIEESGNYSSDLISSLKKHGIFSATIQVRGFSDARNNISVPHLWGHYADGMRGFAIEFNARELLSSLDALNPHDNFITTLIGYQDTLPELTSEFILNKRDEAVRKIHRKHKVWEYEDEYRIISTSPGVKKFSIDSVAAILIGSLMEKDDLKVLTRLIKKYCPSVKVYGVSPVEGQYAVKIDKLQLDD